MTDLAEPNALHEGALVRPTPELSTLEVTGADRLTWLGRMVTGDVKGLAPGQAAYTLATNKIGRILAEVWLVVEAERLLLGVRRELVAALAEHLDAHLVMEDAEVRRDDAFVWWFAYGPKAREVAADAAALGAAVGVGALGTLTVAALAIPEGASTNLAEALCSRANAVLATPAGWERARIERLIPAYGVDFGEGAYPQEARLERFAVSFDKGCYVGQEAVYMLEKRGHAPKRLVRLRVLGAANLAAGAEVLADDGKVAGTVTSAVPDGDDAWALAMLRYAYTANGTVLRIGETRAEVSEPAS